MIYKNQAFAELKETTLKKFLSERTKKLGYSFREGGDKTNVLISGSHAVDLIKIEGLRVSDNDINELNYSAQNKKSRYKKAEDGDLLVGKQYVNAEQRDRGGYKADTNVASMCIELQDECQNTNFESAPHLLLYEIPQIFSEPNKVDAIVSGREVIDLTLFRESRFHKLVKYITKCGIENITSNDCVYVRQGIYDEIADSETIPEKREALLECSRIIKQLDKNDLHYKKVIASLGVLKIHRQYYEEQEHLLYEKTTSRYPINLEIHTCFDVLRQKEGVDVVIGTRLSSAVSDPEIEYLLSSTLEKHGFRTNLSSLNNFTQSNLSHEKECLRSFLDIGSQLLSNEVKEQWADLSQISERDALENSIMRIFHKRLEKICKDAGCAQKLERFLESEKMDIPPNADTAQLINLTEISYQKYISQIVNTADLQLLLKQNLLSLHLDHITHTDRLRGGLMGLSSLRSKFNAKDKYTDPAEPTLRPAIFQIEVAASIMKNSLERHELQLALSEFVSVINDTSFEPKACLKNFMLS